MLEIEHLPGEPGHQGSTQYTTAELANNLEKRKTAINNITDRLMRKIQLLADPSSADDGFDENWQPPANYQIEADKKQLLNDPRALLNTGLMTFELGTVEKYLVGSLSDPEIQLIVDTAFTQAGLDREFKPISNQ